MVGLQLHRHTAVQLCTALILCTVYCTPLIGVQIGVQINLFSQLCFLSTLTPMASSGQLFSLQKDEKLKGNDGGLTFIFFASAAAI